MIAAIVAEAIVIAVLLYLHDRQVKEWRDERQLLLERIQAPERVSVLAPSEPQEPLETDAPQLALVGQIDDRPPIEKEA